MSSRIKPYWCITDIKIRGFKSFGQVPVAFRIQSAHVVGLLGPNGAGETVQKGEPGCPMGIGASEVPKGEPDCPRSPHYSCVMWCAGKSNVLDAICFATGCPASVLRVTTLKELVHQDLAVEVRSNIDGWQSNWGRLKGSGDQ